MYRAPIWIRFIYTFVLQRTHATSTLRIRFTKLRMLRDENSLVRSNSLKHWYMVSSFFHIFGAILGTFMLLVTVRNNRYRWKRIAFANCLGIPAKALADMT